MDKAITMKIIDEICKDKGIEKKNLSFDWIRELKKDGKVAHIVRYSLDLNPAACMNIVNDKYATYAVLKENNIPTLEYNVIFNPKTKSEYSKETEQEIKKYFKLYNGKIVIKTNNSSEGKGVFLFDNEKEALDKVKELFDIEKEDNINICPFENIKEEYRAVFFNGEILFIYKKISPNGNWKLNLANGAIPVEVDDNDLNKEKILDIAKNAGNAINAKFVNVDISKAEDGRIFVMEINGTVCMNKFVERFPGGYEIAKSIYEKAIDAMFD